MGDPRDKFDQTVEGINPFIQSRAPASKSLGPFAVIAYAKPTSIVSFPYADVHGGNLVVAVAAAVFGKPTDINGNLTTALNAEVTIIGRVQGVPSVLKRGFTAKYTGPVLYRFEQWDLYDTIDILARNMAGGHPGPTSARTFADGYVLDLNVSLQPAIVRRGQYG